MIAAVELDDRVAFRGGPREANRAHRGLRSTGHEAKHLDVRHSGDHELRELELELRGNSEARAVAHHSIEGVENDWRRMAEHERAPGKHIVDVLVSVDVPDA